jgi:DNA topoisomerase-3
MGMLSASGMQHLAPFAQQALDNGYVKPIKRVFDDSKVSDHFAIIPTLQAPSGLSDAEQKPVRPGGAPLPGGVLPECRVPGHHPHQPGVESHNFRTEGKVLVKPGWLAIYGKEGRHRRTPKEATRARTWSRASPASSRSPIPSRPRA